MNVAQSFRDRTFRVVDPDARVRNAGDLLTFATYQAGDPLPPGAEVGDRKLIPPGTELAVVEVRAVATGSRNRTVFARTMSLDGVPLGWTSTRNFAGKFVNETIGGLSPAPDANEHGPNAAWEAGAFLGQIELVEIVDAALEIERIAASTVGPYLGMADAARAERVPIAINSGFRSYPEQKFLWDGFSEGRPGFNKAARPGFSKHQNGIAFDIPVGGGAGGPVYDWLKLNATSFGFLRTVSGEPWHWEYDPDRAAAAKERGDFRAPGVSV